jgi:hypothetical protein
MTPPKDSCVSTFSINRPELTFTVKKFILNTSWTSTRSTRESVNRSQMDIKCKSCDIQTWKKHLFLSTSSKNIEWIHLSHCFETCSIEVVWLLSQSLLQLVGYHVWLSNALKRISRPTCEPLYAKNTSHFKQKTFLWISFASNPLSAENAL